MRSRSSGSGPSVLKRGPASGSGDQLLQFSKVFVHFIYSFATSLSTGRSNGCRPDLLKKGWRPCPLHVRLLASDAPIDGGHYQPSLVAKHPEVLQRVGAVARDISVVVPTARYTPQRLGRCRRVQVDVSYSIRLFEAGAGVCTFTVELDGKAATFENIHLILRLAQNVAATAPGARRHLTHTYLAPDGGRILEPELLQSDRSYLSLHDVFQNLFSASIPWLPRDWRKGWVDPTVFDTNGPKGNWQTPYILTVAEVPASSFRQIESPGVAALKQISPILCKMVLDNRTVTMDYQNFGLDYARSVLVTNTPDGPLRNLSLDDRLFIALSRRGSVAATSTLNGMPALFAVPSLLNLVEILRSRWHLGNIVNCYIDKTPFNLARTVQEVVDWHLFFLRTVADFRDAAVRIHIQDGEEEQECQISSTRRSRIPLRRPISKSLGTPGGSLGQPLSGNGTGARKRSQQRNDGSAADQHHSTGRHDHGHRHAVLARYGGGRESHLGGLERPRPRRGPTQQLHRCPHEGKGYSARRPVEKW